MDRRRLASGFLDVIKTVIHTEEHVWGNFGAEAVTSAQILIDPDLDV